MRGRVRGLDGADAEAFVRERLRSIVAAATPGSTVAAATPRSGWVPEPIDERLAPVAPRLAPQSWPGERAVSDAEPVGTPDLPLSSTQESDHQAPVATVPIGRHRGMNGSEQRLRWDPGRPGALALCLVAVLAAVLATGITWWSRPTSSTVDEVNAAPLPAAAQAPGNSGQTDGQQQPGSGTGPDAGPGSVEELVISVIGQVHQPGLVTVTSGARVADAIAAAGGALPAADLSSVNLARLVVDGEQIAVGIPGSALPGGAVPAESNGLVNLNSASQAELEDLPGIGPVLAQRIIDFRAANGGFTAVEELREVSGIGPTVYEDIVDLVTV
ncbi:MAG: ComEA family DNA-binding protein [Actinomycetota bacterium]|nr:ComEA family DNA-binding protein [Actinomycetota bacterium]